MRLVVTMIAKMAAGTATVVGTVLQRDRCGRWAAVSISRTAQRPGRQALRLCEKVNQVMHGTLIVMAMESAARTKCSEAALNIRPDCALL